MALFLPLLFAIFTSGSMGWTYSNGSHFATITPGNFQEVLKENPFVLVVFYKSSAKTKGIEIAEAIALSFLDGSAPPQSKEILYSAVDVDKAQILKETCEIRWNPTVIFYFYGIPLRFPQLHEGEFQISRVKSWLTDALLSQPIDLTKLKDPNHFKRSLQNNPLQVVLVGSIRGRTYSLLKRLSAVPSNANLPVGFADKYDEEWQDHFGLGPDEESDHIFLVSGYTKETLDYKGELNLREIQKWIEDNKFPSFFKSQSSNPATYADYYHETRPILMLLLPVSMSPEEDEKYSRILEEATGLISQKRNVSSFFVHLKPKEQENYLFSINVTEPSVIMFENLQNRLYHVRHIMQAEISAEAILEFHSLWVNGTAKRHYKSSSVAPVPSNITVLSRDNYQEVILNSNKSTFVFFYLKWGTTAQKNLQSLAKVKSFLEKERELNETLQVAFCDASANDIPGVSSGLQRFTALALGSLPNEWVSGLEIRDPRSTLRFLVEKVLPGMSIEEFDPVIDL